MSFAAFVWTIGPFLWGKTNLIILMMTISASQGWFLTIVNMIFKVYSKKNMWRLLLYSILYDTCRMIALLTWFMRSLWRHINYQYSPCMRVSKTHRFLLEFFKTTLIAQHGLCNLSAFLKFCKFVSIGVTSCGFWSPLVLKVGR